MFKVYSPDGKMFEVSADKAKELMDAGWTPWKPEDKPSVKDVFKKKKNTRRKRDNNSES